MPVVGQCVICQDVMKPQDTSAIGKCGHTFHCECISQWFESATTCPMCRVHASASNLIKLFITEADDSSDSDDDDVSSVTSSMTSSSTRYPRGIPVRCRFWPQCTNRSCRFVHPRKLCLTFAEQKCKRGDQCHFIHPQCRKGKHCRDTSCKYSHVLNGLSKTLNVGSRMSMMTSLPIQLNRLNLNVTPEPRQRFINRPRTDVRCRFNTLCRNDKCKFIHPNKCESDETCNRSICVNWHPKRNAARAGNC